MDKQTKVPVLFLVFNRPDTTAVVFQEIRKAQPSRLYIGGDGPRKNKAGESEKVAEVRKIVNEVDWPCEVKLLLREENLGCKHAVSSAITWFFEHEECGIILEDDCLPHPDFFKFCEDLLVRFKDDARIQVITGNNFQFGRKRGEASYYFSKYLHIWGWASWRRAWENFDIEMTFWDEWKVSKAWKRKFPNFFERQIYYNYFEDVARGKIDTWDYIWYACCSYHNGLTITPNVNLVSNIGFGGDATHTFDINSRFSEIPTTGFNHIAHPETVIQNVKADSFLANLNVIYSLRIPYKIKEIIIRNL